AALVRGKVLRIAAGIAVAVLLALVLLHPFEPSIRRGELEMTAIDVGQGDSILLVFPDGRRLLVDGGGLSSFGLRARSNLDIGEDVVAPYLWQRGIRSVDAIAVSHAHEDHIGGLPAIVGAFLPRELWTGATPETPKWRAIREESMRLGARI